MIILSIMEQCIAKIEPTVSDIIGRLRRGEFLNEAAVSGGIVTRLLSDLGWAVYDPAVVWPQYTTDSGRADFALCHPPRKPHIFVEVKAVGKARDGEAQAFRYAFDEGVPLLVVTDGKEWFFYLPGGQGKFSKRQFYALDMQERQPEDCAKTFCQFLAHEAIVSGRAHKEAEKILRDKGRDEEIQKTIPDAWQRLLSEQNEELQVLLAEQVEKMCGHEPDIESVSAFLQKQARFPCDDGENAVSSPPILSSPTTITPPSPPLLSTKGTLTLLYAGRASSQANSKLVGFEIGGIARIRKMPGNAKRTLEEALKGLQRLDPGFLQRLAAHPKATGRRGSLFVAKTREALNPQNPHVAEEHGVDLENGWWMGGPYSQAAVITRIKMACEVGNLRVIDNAAL